MRLGLLHLKLLPDRAGFDFQIIYLLRHELFVLFQLRAHALQPIFIVLVSHVHSLVVAHFNFQFITLLLDFAHRLVCQLQLVRQVVYMSFKRFYFSNLILFFLAKLLDLELRPAHALLEVHVLLIQLVMIFCQLFYALLVSLCLHAGVAIILQNVLFFHLEGPHALLRKPLLVL